MVEYHLLSCSIIVVDFLTFLHVGDDPENISSSGTEEETTDAEEGDDEEAAKQEGGQDALGKTTFSHYIYPFSHYIYSGLDN